MPQRPKPTLGEHSRVLLYDKIIPDPSSQRPKFPKVPKFPKSPSSPSPFGRKSTKADPLEGGGLVPFVPRAVLNARSGDQVQRVRSTPPIWALARLARPKTQAPPPRGRERHLRA